MFDWDDGNLGHLDPNIEPEEAEEAVLDASRVNISAYNIEGERRWGHIGATEAGRVLAVIWTRRDRLIRIITAWDASDDEKRRYRRQKR